MCHASSIHDEGGRVILRMDRADTFDIRDHGRSLADHLSKQNNCDFELKLIESPAYLTGNSDSLSYITISGLGKFHIKAVRTPDLESVYISEVLRKYPGLPSDDAIVIPRIIDVMEAGTENVWLYLHVSRWVESEGTLAQRIIELWFRKHFDDIRALLQAFGAFLRGFRTRYPGLNHNDMNPSNVLLVRRQGLMSFCLIDCAGLDDEVGDDFTTFILSLEVLAQGGFGADFLNIATSAFNSGYSSS